VTEVTGGGRSPERQLLDLMGLAARAGRIISGTDAVRKGVREGEVVLVLLAADASATQHAKLVPLLEARKVRYHLLLSREQLGAAIGRGPVSAIGLADANFARRARALISAFPVPQERVQEEV
jgi:ribosomal protein L7Ae-like RNA K-turn-binding protein